MSKFEVTVEHAEPDPTSELVRAWRVGSDRERLLRQLSGSVLLELLRALKLKTKASHVQAIHPEDAWADRVADYALQDALSLRREDSHGPQRFDPKSWEPRSWSEKLYDVRVAIMADADWYDNRVAPITLDLSFGFKGLGGLSTTRVVAAAEDPVRGSEKDGGRRTDDAIAAARLEARSLESAPRVTLSLRGSTSPRETVTFPLPLISVRKAAGEAPTDPKLLPNIDAAIDELAASPPGATLPMTHTVIRQLRRRGRNGALASIFESTVAETSLERPRPGEAPESMVRLNILKALLGWSREAADGKLNGGVDGYAEVDRFVDFIFTRMKDRLVTEGGHLAPRQPERILRGDDDRSREPNDIVNPK
jgi:hypothetical protein